MTDAVATASTNGATGDATRAAALEELAGIRKSIDNIDAALIHILAERFRHTQHVGKLKADAGLPASDPAREERQVARLRQLAHDADLDPEFAEKFLGFVIAEVINHHERIAAEAE
ncbi:chorismate mutase [Gulosibacter bifidus]|uniref:Chorismate mutase n=1 Tax=Gulosibacter bifidus TaxID=272239 RepID=A0ABW5RJE0_9MICO|nr:chorismate mutase [Gulosibacter bifidus]